MIQSVMNIQTASAKALPVDEGAVETAQLRADQGLAADAVAAFRAGGHAERLAADRGIASVQSAYESL